MIDGRIDFTAPPSGWAQVEEWRRQQQEARRQFDIYEHADVADQKLMTQVGDSEALWQQVLDELRNKMTKPSFVAWLEGTVGLSYTEDAFVVGTPNAFVAAMIEQQIYVLVAETLVDVIGRETEIRFAVAPPSNTSDGHEEEAVRNLTPPTTAELSERTRQESDAAAEEERARKVQLQQLGELLRGTSERRSELVTYWTQRIERERREAESERARQVQLERLAERLDGASELRSKLARYFKVPQSVVSTWESALEMVRKDLDLPGLLDHPELIEIFETMGLGLTDEGVYRLAFASNLRQQVLVNSSSSEVVRAVVRGVLRRAEIDATDVMSVIPGRIDWKLQLKGLTSNGDP